MGHTFISYARADRRYARTLAELLQHHGMTVWLDDRIAPGSHFDEVIEDALDKADKVVVIWSEASVKSQWVRSEAGEGLRRGILIPIVADSSKIPLEFRRVQAIDFSRWRNDPAAPEFDALKRCLGVQSTQVSESVSEAVTQIDELRAELISADRYHCNLRFRVHSGDRSYRLEHEGVGRCQTLQLDGKIIAQGGSLFRLEDYFRCEKVAPGIDRLELSLHGNRIRGIDHVSLRLNGRPVLTSPIPLAKGVEVVIGVTLLMALLTVIGMETVLATFGRGPAMWAVPISLILVLVAFAVRRRSH